MSWYELSTMALIDWYTSFHSDSIDMPPPFVGGTLTSTFLMDWWN